jgi:hypothetical protein
MKVCEPLAVAGSGAQAEYQTPYGLPTPTVICHRRCSAPTGLYVGAGRAIVRGQGVDAGRAAIIELAMASRLYTHRYINAGSK